MKICVIGDLIIDEYIACAPLGMSQEDPTIVGTPTDKARFLGGAGIIALHAASLGSEVTLLSVTGDDLERDYVLSELSSQKVVSKIVKDASRLTTLKQRFQAEGKSLLRVSHLTQSSIDEDIQNELDFINGANSGTVIKWNDWDRAPKLEEDFMSLVSQINNYISVCFI